MNSPLSYLHTFGPAGDPANRLGWGLGIISVAVLVIVTALLMWAIFRRRKGAADRAALEVHSDSGGMPWIYVGVGSTVAMLLWIGTTLTAWAGAVVRPVRARPPQRQQQAWLVLVVVPCAVWTMFTIAAVAMPATTALTLQITGLQWWWSVRYLDEDASRVFTTANEIHIPVGQPVRIELGSPDVIHSFWIPQLAGKMDVIPGQTNATWLQADKPGVYRGQCAEYCGAQHAHMAMYVVADTPADFAAWREQQLRESAVPANRAALAGRDSFVAHCGACHSVRGSGAGGILGPDLSHLMSRKTIAAGLLPNTPANLRRWIADSQAAKPGSRMPSLGLEKAELDSVVGYLGTVE